MNKLFLALAVSPILASCTAHITDTRATFMNKDNQRLIQQSTEYRASLISNSETLYSEQIRCLSPFIAQLNAHKVIDKSVTDSFALAHPSLESDAISQHESNLESLKQEIYNKRVSFRTNELRYQALEKKDELSNEDIHNMAQLSAHNKLLESEINKLKVEISELEGRISEFKRGVISPINRTSRKALSAYIQGNTSKVYSVSPIYDKTEKIFSANSTALSDMVAHALTYNYAIRYMDTPFNTDWAWSRANIQNPSLDKSIGAILPADRYINGALVQYDEGLPININSIDNIRLSIDPLVYNKSTQVMTIGLTLRMSDASGGMHFLGYNEIGEKSVNPNNPLEYNFEFEGFTDYSPASVYVENTFFVNQKGLNIFEITSDRNYGGSISIETSDPKTYAVREMVERATFELLLSTIPNTVYENGRAIPLGYRDQATQECQIKPDQYRPQAVYEQEGV